MVYIKARLLRTLAGTSVNHVSIRESRRDESSSIFPMGTSRPKRGARKPRQRIPAAKKKRRLRFIHIPFFSIGGNKGELQGYNREPVSKHRFGIIPPQTERGST
jgi:hypothetical protein